MCLYFLILLPSVSIDDDQIVAAPKGQKPPITGQWGSQNRILYLKFPHIHGDIFHLGSLQLTRYQLGLVEGSILEIGTPEGRIVEHGFGEIGVGNLDIIKIEVGENKSKFVDESDGYWCLLRSIFEFLRILYYLYQPRICSFPLVTFFQHLHQILITIHFLHMQIPITVLQEEGISLT